MQNLVISHCFAEDSKELYKVLSHAKPSFCSLNFLFCDILIAVNVVVCLSPLLFKLVYPPPPKAMFE